jgi:hypothetical protein
MATFPTLSVSPEIDSWEDEVSYNPTIRSEYEGGYILTRPRFTRIIRKWNVVYKGISDTEMQQVKDFENSIYVGSDAFEWLNPVDNVIYTVRLLEPIKYKMINNKYYWQISLVLEQV